LDVDAVRAVTRLIDKGFEAYLVGGCVRDLLLDRTPKDYDIATEARPPQVKRTFPRNCRIIGRRFKLAHLHFHGNTKILECSTFRRTPQERPEGDGDDADLLITRDNEFGTAEEDAVRRDFTVNALFLDPTRDLIVDHCNGLEDIEAKVIRTIGDPVVRFREDPVRILRAAKFAGRLGFTVEKHTLAAMGETAEDLKRAAPPRVLEEILRLLRSGHAHSSFELLRDVGAIEHLIPVVGTFLKKASDEQQETFWGLLDALDRRVQSQPDGSEPPPNGVLLAVMMYGAVEAERERQPTRSASSIAERLLGSLAIDLRLPRRDSGCLKRVCGVQHRFEQAENKRRFGVEAFLHSPYFEEALQLYALRTAAAGNERTNVDHWYDLAGTHPLEDDEQASGSSEAPSSRDEARAVAHEVVNDENDEDAAPRKKRRRRRRRSEDDRDRETADREQAAPNSEAADNPAEPSSVDAHSLERDTLERDSLEQNTFQQDTAEENVNDYAADDEPAPAPKKKATRKKAAKKVAAKKPATRKAPARKKPRTEEEDLSDVTFPSSDEPSPHGDPMHSRSKSEQPTTAERGRAQPAFPKDRGNDTEEAHEESRGDTDRHSRRRDSRDRDDRGDRDGQNRDRHDDESREAKTSDASTADERDDEPRRPRAPRSRRGGSRRRSGQDDDDARATQRGDDARDGDHRDEAPRGEDLHDDEATAERDEQSGDDRARDDRARDDRARGDRARDEGERNDGNDRDGASPRPRRRRGRRGRPRADDDRGDDRGEARGDRVAGARDDGEARDRDAADRGQGDRDRGDRDQGDREQGARASSGRGQGGRNQSARSQDNRSQGNRDSGDRHEKGRPRRGRSRLKDKKPGDGRDREQRDGNRTSNRDGRREGKRDGKRDGKRGKRPARPSGGRDVDVVPRYRDRRGKVEVIEPPSLDLSAFDVELDPKRVPTFGSIVEGKGRPKRKGPRVPDGEADSYRPPPPPGSDGKRPDSPPPAPSADGPDTFGDW
tara:strand:+ start:4467 stop:7472 length:3006 start_codon:yes stop_codon:yes gene_type:complete